MLAVGARRLSTIALLVCLAGCKAGGCVANVLGDIVGATGDVACDRRFVQEGKEPAPFCQEEIDTIAVSEIADDCREKHGAHTYEGRCPRERILGGCKLHKENDDGSEVWDWYYDVSDLEADPDAGPDSGIVFVDPVRSTDEVKALCADRSRYEEGATFQERP